MPKIPIILSIIVIFVLVGALTQYIAKSQDNESDAMQIVHACALHTDSAAQECFQTEITKKLAHNPHKNKPLFKDLWTIAKNRKYNLDGRIISIAEHHSGMQMIKEGATVSQAYALCTDTAKQGCIHGSIMEAIAQKGDQYPPQLYKTLCTTQQHANCLHAVGHSIAIKYSSDINQALRYCTLNLDNEDATYCSGGVFMEILEMGEDRDICPNITEKMKPICYYYLGKSLQAYPSHTTFQHSFTQCQKVETPYVSNCIEGVTEQLSLSQAKDPAKK